MSARGDAGHARNSAMSAVTVRAAMRNAAHTVRRGVVTETVELVTVGIPTDVRPTLIVANHQAHIDREIIAAAWNQPVLGRERGMRRGMASLIFPEGGISPDGSLGAFHPQAFDVVRRMRDRGGTVAIIPVAITGTFGLDEGLPWGASASEQPLVTVRAGDYIVAGDESAVGLAERVRDAVAELLAESESTWWRRRRHGAGEVAAPSPSWRTAWKHSDAALSPGQTPRRKIWA